MCKFGLALGGGGTRGAYHIGVWNAIEKMGIEVSAICGTSIGAINAAMICQGDSKKAEELWENIGIDDIIDTSSMGNIGNNVLDSKNFINLVNIIYKNNGIETEPLKNTLNDLIDEEKVRNSKYRFGLVTFAWDTKERKVCFIEDIPNGQLVDYIMASAALPVFKQTKINDKSYLDGGFVEKIPTKMLVDSGVNDIIEVDIGGIGIVPNIGKFGLNKVSIKTSENLVGLLDFNNEAFVDLIKMGYFDTLKAFNRIEGEIYSYNIADYHSTKLKYSDGVISGIEKTAEILAIDKYKIYKFDDLKDAVINEVLRNLSDYNKQSIQLPTFEGFKINKKDMLFKYIYHIINNDTDALSNMIFQGVLGDIYIAANACCYFINKN